MIEHNLVSKEDGSINPKILKRDYEIEVAYGILQAKYERLLESMQSIKDIIEAEIEWSANAGNLVGETEKEYFIRGLKQALYLIEKVSPIA